MTGSGPGSGRSATALCASQPNRGRSPECASDGVAEYAGAHAADFLFDSHHSAVPAGTFAAAAKLGKAREVLLNDLAFALLGLGRGRWGGRGRSVRRRADRRRRGRFRDGRNPWGRAVFAGDRSGQGQHFVVSAAGRTGEVKRRWAGVLAPPAPPEGEEEWETMRLARSRVNPGNRPA